GPVLDATVPLPATDLLASTDVTGAYSQTLSDAYALKISASDALKKVQDTINGLLTGKTH
ncbi:MAG: hypothetical protein ACR2JY_12780, partial [Chloroflexota bacterium]